MALGSIYGKTGAWVVTEEGAANAWQPALGDEMFRRIGVAQEDASRQYKSAGKGVSPRARTEKETVPIIAVAIASDHSARETYSCPSRSLDRARMDAPTLGSGPDRCPRQ